MMRPCNTTLCQGGETLYSVYLGMLDAGFSGDMAKLNRYMMQHNAYFIDDHGNCSTNWGALDYLNIVHFDGQYQDVGFYRVCSECPKKVYVVRYMEKGYPRAGFVHSCDHIRFLTIQDAKGGFNKILYTPALRFLVFSYL